MTTTTQNKTYFNLHTDGLAFLNNVDFVTPKTPGKTPGTKQFLSLSVTLLEGDPENPHKTYVSLVIPDALDEISALLVKHREAIVNRDIVVFANLKLAKLRHKPFVYGANSPKAGELGVNLDATLIGLSYLKIGDQVVYERTENNQNAKATVTNAAVEPVSQQASVQSTTVAVVAPSASPATNNDSLAFCSELNTVGGELFETPLQITLSKDSPQFETRKEAIRAAGYRWNSDTFTWMKPEIELAKDDSAFEQKKQLLKELNYRFDGNLKTWRVAFSRGSNQRQG
jgi:hypothetical protein